eukprot:CAMPEP_0177356080 /NCGR_PEP_ID=MMETSP0368-20130122/34329_1 /TAXON_ID=447022 ORGANISM="Scrippsiella hangoei-like, Strain SHHI-4" /NCGR_SAMPLE_ID=MMETSP0368 /ASSEMBLY_ACC=CAM_ASM_000363 /LENGTH=66 /DNA_ID=CAMNT_0018818377 /DNA_START=377 /DNA_END=574 /DNA_ORIENTATION=+
MEALCAELCEAKSEANETHCVCVHCRKAVFMASSSAPRKRLAMDANCQFTTPQGKKTERLFNWQCV